MWTVLEGSCQVISLMIVDDEPLFRDFLVNFIPWEEYGFQIVAEAKNGLEALNLADQFQPNLVLTDINMPKMDGIEFATELLKTAPETSVVFITGHNEFDYARKAVRLGASDYILKPFEKEELIITLLKIKDNIHEANTDSLEAEESPADFIMPLLTSDILSRDQKLIATAESMGFTEDKQFGVVCVDIDHLEHRYTNQEEKMLWRFSVMNIFKELLEEDPSINSDQCHIFYDYEGNITCLYLYDDGLALDELEQVLRQLAESVSKYLDFTVTIGISQVHQGLKGIGLAYDEALSALHHKFIDYDRKLIHFKDVPKENSDFTWYNASVNESLLSALRSRDKDKLLGELHDLYGHMKDHHITYEFSKIIQQGLISLLLSHITQSGKTLELIAGSAAPFDAVEKADTLELQKEALSGLFIKTIDYFKSTTTSRSSQIAVTGKTYIDDHYQNSSLTVQDIASAQFINQTYLRSMFKKEYGITVSDYLTKTRMEHAASLLKEKTHRLADIAQMVGYNDSSYFSKCFKKFYGVTPSQFEINQ